MNAENIYRNLYSYTARIVYGSVFSVVHALLATGEVRSPFPIPNGPSFDQFGRVCFGCVVEGWCESPARGVKNCGRLGLPAYFQ